MKNLSFILASLLLLASCSKNDDDSVQTPLDNEMENVTLSFSPYSMESMTRAATDIKSYCTHLDVFLVEGDNVIALHQASTESNFGTLSCTLNKTKTYTMYAVAHKLTSNATLEDNIISFPDNKIGETFYYTTSFSPSTTTTLSCAMTRIIGQFKMQTTDAVPDDCTQLKITVMQTPCAYKVDDNTLVNPIDKVTHYTSITKDAQGRASFTASILATNEGETYDILVQALRADDSVIEEKTFTDVPIKRNFKTVYTGTFYISTLTDVSFSGHDYNSTNTEVEF